MSKTVLHTFDQMVQWARENPYGFPDWHFYDYSEIAFARRLQEEVRRSNWLVKSFPSRFEKDSLFKRIKKAVKCIITA